MKTPSPWALVAAALAGCAEMGSSIDDPLARWTGSAPRIALAVSGPAADGDKRSRCSETVRTLGAWLDDEADIRAELSIGGSGNRLTIRQRGQVILDEPRPDWGMRDLCTDLVRQSVRFLATLRAPPSEEANAPAPPPGPRARQERPPAAMAAPVAAPPARAPVAAPPARAPVATSPVRAPVAASPVRAPARRGPPRGKLIIRSTPPGAAISIDGVAAGSAPLVSPELPVGEHVIEATWSQGRFHVSTARAQARGPRTVEVALE